MSTGGGTGQPRIFVCSKCRRSLSRYRRSGGCEFRLTGKVRYSNTGIGGPLVAGTRYQYTCDCGHTGWTRHLHVALRADREGIRPHPNDESGIRRFESR